mgnify:CR=1 FL=1
MIQALIDTGHYMCPADELHQVIEVAVYEYRAAGSDRTHIYRVPQDVSYLDKWRRSNPGCFYGEPFLARITAKLEKAASGE